MTHGTRSAVIELQRKDGNEIVGFGFGVFVKKSFADAELRNPAPGLNCRIIESVLDGNSVVATYEEVRDANTRGDLDQVVLETSWKEGHLDAEQVQEVRVLLAKCYQELYAGYRFSRILSECVDERDFWHAQGLRSFQIVDRFEEYWKVNPDARWNPQRALSVATAETMRGDPGSVAAALFHRHRDPQFGFTREEQELLDLAMEGMDDLAATKALFVTLPAIKRRWQNIFHRVAALMPDLCPPDGDGTRGIQKRQRILTYVRNHPEELRPFDFRKIQKPQR
ncbi:MAG: hypothetical protein ROO76_02270 [Terriglobia bacterium]|nr:hypothetical protein [Terriglobia bacterium]